MISVENGGARKLWLSEIYATRRGFDCATVSVFPISFQGFCVESLLQRNALSVLIGTVPYPNQICRNVVYVCSVIWHANNEQARRNSKFAGRIIITCRSVPNATHRRFDWRSNEMVDEPKVSILQASKLMLISYSLFTTCMTFCKPAILTSISSNPSQQYLSTCVSPCIALNINIWRAERQYWGVTWYLQNKYYDHTLVPKPFSIHLITWFKIVCVYWSRREQKAIYYYVHRDLGTFNITVCKCKYLKI